MSKKTTAPLRSQATRDRILESAQALFGEAGYEDTTVRLVAERADIHPSLVMRYFGSKEGLFAAAVKFDLRLPDLTAVKQSERGEVLVRHFLARWEGEKAGEELPSLLRVTVTHPEGAARLAAIFQEQVVPALARIVPRKQLARRAALLATQLVGLAFTRYVVRLPAVVALSHEEIIESVGATLQRCLHGD